MYDVKSYTRMAFDDLSTAAKEYARKRDLSRTKSFIDTATAEETHAVLDAVDRNLARDTVKGA